MILLRRQLGDELRQQRLRQGRTLREVSAGARVSLGYLSEVERGQKEASSELLASICSALEIPLSVLLRDVADRVATVEPGAPVAPPSLDVARAAGPVAPVTNAVATSVAA
jgi:transcriptional regulator with XRE-family HTH domain